MGSVWSDTPEALAADLADWDLYQGNFIFQARFDGGTASITAYHTPVPIPAAAWLLGSGLIGLVAIRRRFKK